MKQDRRLALWSGLAGLGLIALGGWAYYRERKVAGAAGMVAGLGRGFREARMIDSFNDGNMKTELRADAEMPIEMRIATIQRLIHKSVQDPEMRKISLRVTSRCPERDKMCEAKAIYDYVKAHVRYTGDIGPIKHPDGSVEGIDLYQSARRTLEMGGGDCDDHNILISTMLAQNGLTAKLRVVKTKKAPDWEHIFPGFVDTGKFVALDSTIPGADNFGIEAPYHKRVDFDA